MLKNIKQVYKNNTRPKAFLTSLLFFGLAYGLYHGLQDNYLAQIVNVDSFKRGIVEFFRELPGLLLIGFLAMMYRFSDEKIYKLGSLISVLGLFLIAIVKPSFSLVLFTMVIFSLGEHLIMPVKSSISMNLAFDNMSGESMGITNSLSSIGRIIGYFIIALIFPLLTNLIGEIQTFKLLFFISAIFCLIAFINSLFIKNNEKKKPVKLYFRKKYYKYYMLEVFYGARKQVFITFAPFLIILYYGANAALISFLLGLSALFSFLFSPYIGKLIDKIGYKKIMVYDTIILFFVCILYGYSHKIFPTKIALIVICVNYILDSILTICSLANNVYVNDLSESDEEISATLATGISVNHVISVIIALTGGYIWATVGIEILFTISGILGLLNTLYALTIKPIDKNKI